MRHVYRLTHRQKVYFHEDFGWVCDDKTIGCFSTFAMVDRVRKKYQKLAGFQDFPNHFLIEKIPIFEMKKNVFSFYELTYFFDDGYGNDVVLYSGLFAARKKAKSERDILKKNLPFSLRQEDFSIFHVKTDRCSWCEGFVRAKEI